MSTKQGRRGNILISVLWVILAMTLLVMGLSYEARGDIERTMLNRDRTKAYWLARGAVEQVKYEYAAMQARRGRQDPNARPQVRYRFEFEEGWAECLITTSSSSMSVNTKDRNQWLQLLTLYGLDQAQRDEIADAIIDWGDKDDLPGVNGAESEYYMSLTPPYQPRNGLFFSVEELSLVRGITDKMFYGSKQDGIQVPGLQELLSVSGSTQGFDINTCPKGILMAFLEITEEEAAQIVALREEEMIENLQEGLSGVPINAPGNLRFFRAQLASGTKFTIRATGYINGSQARYTVEDDVTYQGGVSIYRNRAHKDFSLDHVDETLLEEETNDR